MITTVAGNGVEGFSGDNGPAITAQLALPFGVAVDSAGNLYIADVNNNRISKVSNGVITTVAGNGTRGFGGDNGPATSAQLDGPAGVALDPTGNLYIADGGNNRIRKVSNGVITTVAGNGMQGFSGDNSPAITAQLASPVGVAVDSAGNLYIADADNQRIRKVSNGVITTVAGNGTLGFIGDGPAISSQLWNPQGVSVDSAGNLYIADGNYRIRVLTLIGSSCTYSVAPVSLQAPGSGGNLTVSIQTTASCSWTVSGLPSWVTVSGASSGTGSATVTLVVAANATGAARSTTILIAGVSVTVTQVTQPSALILTITTASPLLPAATGLAYSQTLSATGGAPPYTWSIFSGTLPSGLTLSASGAITGTPTTTGVSTFAVRVSDSSLATATQTYTLTVTTAGTLARSGVLAHIAAGGGWTTVISLINTSASPVAVTIVLHAEDGSTLSLPVTTTQQGVIQTATTASLNGVLNPNTTLLISTGDQIVSTVVGWADVLSSGPVSGFAIFRQTASNGTASERTVPLQSQFTSKIILPYDNTAGFVTGVAIANLATASVTVTATIWDQNGSQLGAQSITLSGSGHTSFAFPDRLAVAAGKQGIVVFQSTGSSGITGVGLRFSPFGTFTSVPTILSQ